MSNELQKAIEIGKIAARVLGAVVSLIKQAGDGDEDAIAELKRVDQVLTPTSPTESAFERADEIAAGKPSRDDEPTNPG